MSGWRPVDLAAVLAGDGPPAPTVGPARDDGQRPFYPGRINALYGESESGKTWLALAAAAEELAAGRVVVMLDWEDSAAGAVDRLRALGVADRDILRGLVYVSPDSPLTPVDRDQLEPLVRAASLVILDATTEALAGEGKQSRSDVDVAEFFRVLPRWAADLGPAVVLIDHVVKDPEGARGPTGSQHKRSGITGVAYVVSPVSPMGRGRKGRSRVLVSKDRLGHVRGHAVRSRAGDWWADMVHDAESEGGAVWVTLWAPVVELESKADSREKAIVDRMPAVLDAIRGAREPLTTRKVQIRVKGTKEVTAAALARLVDTGQVVATQRGQSTLHTLPSDTR